jgi:two-component system, cell cycle response regulator DivK
VSRLVLVVDDHDLNRRMLTMLLEMDGHRVVQAASAGEVRARMAELVPEVVLMDVSLPDGDGLDLVRELRADRRYTGVRFYAVTAHVMDETRRRASESGCDGFFEKPLDTDAVLATVQAAAA